MERSPLGRDPPNTSVRLVAVGMAERSLVMSDDRVEPVGEVDGAVRSHVQVDGTKGIVRGSEERGQGLQTVTGTVDGWA